MAVPLIKWAGGKRQLLGDLLKLVPEEFGTYFEPFFGGGAMFFELKSQSRIQKAVISDINSRLLNFYLVLKEAPLLLWEELENLHYGNSPKDYYEARQRFNAEDRGKPSLDAALFLYLNRHCYNGLYRVNSRGQFNVPFGRYKNPLTLDRVRILEGSGMLKNTQVINSDFEEALKGTTSGDFVYLDPPYSPLSLTSNFTGYHQGGFDSSNQKRLSGMFRTLDQKGVSVMLSNSATPEIVELYQGYNTIRVGARRRINSRATGRGKIDELLVTNF